MFPNWTLHKALKSGLVKSESSTITAQTLVAGLLQSMQITEI